MGRKRPRSRPARTPRSPRAPYPSRSRSSEGERARLRRNRPLTWRSALLLLVPLALLAAAADVGLYAFVSDHYAKHGHLAFPLHVGTTAIGFTALMVYGSIAMWRELRKTRRLLHKSRRPP